MLKNTKPIMVSILTFFLLFLPLSSYVAADTQPEEPTLYSDAAFLYSLDNEEVLLTKNENEPFPVHNLSMLMTMYLVFQDIEKGKISLEDEITVSENAWKSSFPKMYLEIGRKVTVQKLLEGLTIASGNDAAIATAELLEKTSEKFVERMNKEAEKLKMTNTTFHSPNGTNQDISTAKDIFLLTKEITTNYPQYQTYFTQTEMKYETRPGNEMVLDNQNNFIHNNSSATGLKSGWGNGQYHLAATVDKNGMKFIGITLNASNPSKRSNDMTKLLSFGYAQFTPIQVAEAGDKYSQFSIYKSTTPGPSDVIYKEDIVVVTKKGVTVQDLDIVYEGNDYILGGTNSGDEVGKVKIYHNDKLLAEESIVSTESFEKVGGFNALLDSIALLFSNLLDVVSNLFE